MFLDAGKFKIRKACKVKSSCVFMARGAGGLGEVEGSGSRKQMGKEKRQNMLGSLTS